MERCSRCSHICWGFFLGTHPSFEGTSSRIFCLNVQHRAKRGLTLGPASWEPAMQFTWQTLDGATKPITGPHGRNWGGKTASARCFGVSLHRYWNGVAIAASTGAGCCPGAAIPSTFALAFGCILDTLKLSRDCRSWTNLKALH